jgi:glycosyltransferase involved in cell wall biosynthesis
VSSHRGPLGSAASRLEIELLLCCARVELDSALPRIAQLVEQELDWTFLVRTALSHGVTPLLARALDRVPSDRLPGEIRDALRIHFEDNRERNEVLTRELLALLDTLAGHRVLAIPFKGPSLGVVAYGDPSLRRAGDLDLVVRENDIQVVCEVLAAAGYRELTERESGRPLSPAEHAAYRRYQCEYAFVRDSDGLVVEPHWSIAPNTWALPLDYEGFWSRARPLSIGGREVPSLALEDLPLVLCVHGAKHQWTELRWICDIAALIARHPEIDWCVGLARARAQRSERMLLLGLGLAGRVLGTELPPPVRTRLEADHAAGALVEEVSARLFQADYKATAPSRLNRFHLRLREHLRDRIRYTLKTILTPTVEQHIRLLPLPPRLTFLHVPLKLAHDYVALPLWLLVRRLGRHGDFRGHSAPPGDHGRPLLVIDWVPHLREGAGFPRMNAILRLLVRAGYRVTLHPVHPCSEAPEALYLDIPREIDVIRDRGIDDVEKFLAAHWREFAAILVSRPPTMVRLGPVFARHPEFASRASLIYDAEAVFAMRDIRQHRVLGRPLDEAAAARRLADETALAARADAVTVVSLEEQELFRRYAGRKAHILRYPIEAAPTPRPFRERRGLLFVGRLVEDDWPNADGLVWFLDSVFSDLHRRLAACGHDLTLTVAGMTGARRLKGRADPRIQFLGVVDDLTSLYDQARVFIAPTRFSAGVPLKIYDAAARGLPVVATRLLADQLGWSPGEDLLAGNVSDAEAFVSNVVELYTRPERWERVRESALARVKVECSPEVCLATLAPLLGARRASR